MARDQAAFCELKGICESFMVRILKIGGSVITDKTRPSASRPDMIEQIAMELVACSMSGLILVHGAGSFGHIQAAQYGLPERFSAEGLLKTHQSVVLLNSMIVDALFAAGASPVPVHPFSSTVLRDGRIEEMALSPIAEMSSRGLLPVLHGDVAIDLSRGSGIVSGDQIVSYLAERLRANRVVLGTDVDGIICEGRTLKEISRQDLGAFDIGCGPGVDITGGMRGKLWELLDLADRGITSEIFNAVRPGNIKRVLLGEHLGTIVRGSA